MRGVARVAELEQLLDSDSFERLNLKSYLAVEEKDFNAARRAVSLYLQKSKDEQDRVHEHIAYHQLGYIERSAGNLEQALQWIETEAAFLQNYFPEDHYRQSVNLYEQGYIRLQLGDIKAAETWMNQALSYALESDDLINQGCAYRGLGEIKRTDGQINDARHYFEKAFSLFQQAEDFIDAEEVEEMIDEL